MDTFYDEWLRYWDDEQKERAQARNYIHEEELEWVRTKQDFRAALLCSRQNGFITAGEVMLGEIPPGWNTGKHSHGEEGIFIISGEGFSVVDGKRYDWDTGSCLFMPYGSIHQHFNNGDETVRYLSTMSLALERFASLARVVQYEEANETPMNEPQVEMAESEVHPEYGRIVLRKKDALIMRHGSEESKAKLAMRNDEYSQSLVKEMREEIHHSRRIDLMWAPENEFKAREVQITAILCDTPGAHSEKHSHMEAVVYALQGEGYSIVGGEKVEFKKGTLMQVPGPDTVHQLGNNTGNEETQLLRIHYGLRSVYFQPIAQRVFPCKFYKFSTYE